VCRLSWSQDAVSQAHGLTHLTLGFGLGPTPTIWAFDPCHRAFIVTGRGVPIYIRRSLRGSDLSSAAYSAVSRDGALSVVNHGATL
jgi:hypothetical protein